jgi:hypothetical protein
MGAVLSIVAKTRTFKEPLVFCEAGHINFGPAFLKQGNPVAERVNQSLKPFLIKEASSANELPVLNPWKLS